ncbi:neurofilament heavy polypeptide-like [Brachyistius frenatus]|uniref:neurofilament heavy polypeptide-like n=1 Tax=Brachyistius frenatus TaxID=100188 RepID=UPI0037E79CFF
MWGVGTDESNEYAGIDCSQPVPSIISGHLASEAAGHNADAASPLTQRDIPQKEETSEQRAEAEEELKKPHSMQTSSSVPSGPRTPEASVRSSSSSEEQSETAGVRSSGFEKPSSPPSAPEESTGDSQPCASPESPRPTAPKTPERIKPPASSVATVSSSSTSSPSSGATLSSSPSFQMPALFSGLRVLKKGAVGGDREVVSEIKQREKDADLALLNLKKTVNKAKLFPEQKTGSPVKKHAEPKSVAETKSTVMGQLSQLLSLDNNDVRKKSADKQEADTVRCKKESENEKEVSGEKSSDSETPTSTPERKKTSDLAYETFRTLFGPKTGQKEKTENVDLEAVKKKIKNDKESLRLIFERTSKSPSKELKSPTEVIVRSHNRKPLHHITVF